MSAATHALLEICSLVILFVLAILMKTPCKSNPVVPDARFTLKMRFLGVTFRVLRTAYEKVRRRSSAIQDLHTSAGEEGGPGCVSQDFITVSTAVAPEPVLEGPLISAPEKHNYHLLS